MASLQTMPADPLPLGPAQPEPSRFRALVLTIFRIFGVDRAIAYTLVGRGWSVIAGPLTIVMQQVREGLGITNEVILLYNSDTAVP
jgi:hypothetical protein